MVSVDSSEPVGWRPASRAQAPARSPVWRRESRAAPRAGRRLAALAAAGLGLALGCALTLWVVLWYAPPPPFALRLIGAGYETNLAVPHNVYGWRTLQRLADDPVPRARLGRGPLRLRAGTPWDADLGSADEPAVLVYFSLHGGADEQGAYLLPDDADTRDLPANRLRVEAILDRLAGLPAQQAKVLILDATQVGSSWPLGMVRNEFVRSLLDLAPRVAEVPNLVVLCSSGPDQRSWASPEAGETVFGYFLREALAGNSDDPSADGWIQLDEAFDTVARRVGLWAQYNRAAVQTPVLLPEGEEGRRRAARVTLARFTGQSLPAPSPPADLLAGREAAWEAAWRTAGELAARKPAPYVYAPEQWRRYLAMLLRYEALLAAGDAESADRLYGALREAEERLRDQALRLNSVRNALPMRVAAGYPAATPDDVRDLAAALWDLPPAEAEKRWLARNPGAGGVEESALLRLQLTQLFLERDAQATVPQTDRLLRLLKMVEDPSHPRPVETQLLTILNADLPPAPPPPELVRLAVRVRAVAERAVLGIAAGSGDHPFPYSERVFPFVESIVGRADAARLVGQDLLFGGGEPAWEKARAALAQAEGLYRKALARAADVSRFLDARDRALAELPYYSRWLARSGPGPGSPAAANAPQGQGPAVRVERLWAALYQGEQDYRAALRAPDSDDALARVRAAAGEIAGSLSAVAAEFDALLGDVAGVNLPGTWHQAEAVLEVPFPDPARRHGVLENRRAVSHRLSDEFFLSSRDFDPQLVSESSARAASNARARRAGEVALAYISGLMDAAAGARESPAEIRTRLETFAAAPAEEGWRSLRKAGVEIGRCLSGLPGRIDRSLGEIRVEAGRADAPGQLEQVDFLARFVDGADAGRVRGDPAGSCRRAWMRPLLLNLARRTWEEHWFDVRESGDPYYRRAGRLYLDDARDMLPDGGGGTDPEEAALRQRVVSASGRLRLVPASARAAAEGFVAATTEPTLALDFRLGPAEGAIVPAGTAAWEVVAEDGLRPAPPAGAPPGSRGLAPVGAKEGAGLGVRLENLLLAGFEEDPPADPGPVEKKVTVRALFRGQWVTAELPVRIYPAPEVTVNHFPRPRRASLAVRASPELLRRYGSGGGAVTIVLDCSGSMGPPEGTAPADSKFARAVNTLAEVLADVPEGTAVSLWVFGQSGGGTGPAQTPEETVRKLLPMTRWDPGMLRPLLARLRGLRTWNESPILHCMFDALADLRRASGYRTMLVLTDGMDNRIDKDPEYNPGGAKDAATLLREHFAGSGVRVHVVGFEVSPEEEKKAAAQFRGLAELDPPGSFTTVKGVDRLRAALRRGLRPELRYWLETDENLPVPGVPAGGLEVGTDGGDRWFSPGLPPGGYQVETQAGGRRDRGVRLGPGDRLLLGLLPADGGVAFERILYSGSDFPHRPAVERGGWRAALLQNQRRGRGVQALVALEKTFDPAETVLQQLWPRDVWFEFDPAGPNAARPRLKWNAAYGYPAPAWNLTTPAWPSPGGDPAKPVVRLWWNPDQEAPVASRLDRGADFRQVTDVRGVTLFVDRRPVTVEGLTVEEHVIDVTPSTRARKKCLVVRLTWPPQEGGGPARPGTVRVRLRGGGFDGSAHWHFAAAGAATALFWRDDGEVPADAVEAVELISLDQFRRDAERRGFSAVLGPLPAPDPADERPHPPLPLP